jgi:signal transduction histidine kinase
MVAELLSRPSQHVPLRLQQVFERKVSHLYRVLDDLLHISRASVAKLKLERQRVDLNHIVESVVQTWRPEMDSRTQRFELRMPQQALLLEGDPMRLEQIFDNLLGNACQYTPAGGQIALTAKCEGDTVVITINDSGVGIDTELLPNIFEPFVQTPGAIDFDSGGLGIGLTVVRELVLAHGGEVAASSAGPGLGSQFVVKLPLLGQP